ncbi:MAG: hypothetical protein JWM32_2243 [Verrucomicrobia bacterium]|nr:hypothetical protein [Verrucomicrobiota bacterium]
MFVAGIFGFLPILIVIFVVISVIRTAAKVAKAAGNQAKTPRRSADFDPMEAERTRRIQEEIRRKIAARRGGSVLDESVEAPQPPESEWQRPPVMESEAVPPPLAWSDGAVLERQNQLARQMRELEEARSQQQRRAAAVASVARADREQAAAVGVMRGDLLADLRSAPTARRAILLREILDKPVALR